MPEAQQSSSKLQNLIATTIEVYLMGVLGLTSASVLHSTANQTISTDDTSTPDTKKLRRESEPHSCLLQHERPKSGARRKTMEATIWTIGTWIWLEKEIKKPQDT